MKDVLSFRGFLEKTVQPVEKQDSDDNLDVLSLTDLELGVDQSAHKDVFAGSWLKLPGNKIIAGLSGYDVKVNGDTVSLTPLTYGNKVLRRSPSGKLIKLDGDNIPKTPIVMSKAQYVNIINRNLGQSGSMGIPGGI